MPATFLDRVVDQPVDFDFHVNPLELLQGSIDRQTIMAFHSASCKRPGCMLWTHVLLLVLLLLALSMGTNATTADQGTKTANISAPSGAWGRAPSPAPISKKPAGAATRWWGPFTSAADAGWVLAAFLECVGLGAYYVWGGVPQPQPPPLLQPPQDEGGGLLQRLQTLWTQHWPDLQQHLPPALGHLLGQWQAHGPQVSRVLAVAGAVTVVGSGGWIVYQEQQRIAAMPGCWPHMLAAAARGDDNGRGSWWTLPRRAWAFGQAAFGQAASTGPCSGGQQRMHLYSVAFVYRLYAALQAALRTVLHGGGRSILDTALALGHGKVRAADVVALVENRARSVLVGMKERSRSALMWAGDHIQCAWVWVEERSQCARGWVEDWVQGGLVWMKDRVQWMLVGMEDGAQRASEWLERVGDIVMDATLALAGHATARAAEAAAWGKEHAAWALGWLVRTSTVITVVLLLLLLFGVLWWYRDLELEGIQVRLMFALLSRSDF